MADVTDQATDLEDLQREYSLQEHKRRHPQRPRTEHCVECGEHIPEPRQRVLGGTDICVDCAE